MIQLVLLSQTKLKPDIWSVQDNFSNQTKLFILENLSRDCGDARVDAAQALKPTYGNGPVQAQFTFFNHHPKANANEWDEDE